MKTNPNRIGIEVLSQDALKQHGDQISGGFGAVELAGGMVTVTAGLVASFLALQRAYVSGNEFARVAADVFTNLTRAGWVRLAVGMRDWAMDGSDTERYYNIVRGRLETWGDNVFDAFAHAGRVTAPAVLPK